MKVELNIDIKELAKEITKELKKEFKNEKSEFYNKLIEKDNVSASNQDILQTSDKDYWNVAKITNIENLDGLTKIHLANRKPISFPTDYFNSSFYELIGKDVYVFIEKNNKLSRIEIPKSCFSSSFKKDRRINVSQGGTIAVETKEDFEPKNFPNEIKFSISEVETCLKENVKWNYKTDDQSIIAECMIFLYAKNVLKVGFDWLSSKDKFSKVDFIIPKVNISIDLKTLEQHRHRLILDEEKILDKNVANVLIHSVLKQQKNEYKLYLNGWIASKDFAKKAKYEHDFPKPNNPSYILDNAHLVPMNELNANSNQIYNFLWINP
jgi:hypothetical protein